MIPLIMYLRSFPQLKDILIDLNFEKNRIKGNQKVGMIYVDVLNPIIRIYFY
jgi:hypothetical protein